MSVIRVIVNISAVATSVVTQGHILWNKVVKLIVDNVHWAACIHSADPVRMYIWILLPDPSV